MTASIPGGQSEPATGAATTPSEPPAAGTVDLERSIARLLTVGTYASIALLAIGVALLLATGVGPLSGGPVFDQARLVPDLLGARPAGFIWAGLLLIVATPAARVTAALVGYGRAGERSMVVVAALVLVVIAVSVAVARSVEG